MPLFSGCDPSATTVESATMSMSLTTMFPSESSHTMTYPRICWPLGSHWQRKSVMMGLSTFWVGGAPGAPPREKAEDNPLSKTPVSISAEFIRSVDCTWSNSSNTWCLVQMTAPSKRSNSLRLRVWPCCSIRAMHCSFVISAPGT